MHGAPSAGGHASLEEQDPVITAREAAKDIAFGSIAGMVAEIFEYPFDLAKVRLQAQVLTPASSNITRFNGPLHCLMHTWKEEGFRGLYRGLPAPLVGAMAETASLFFAYTSFQNSIRSFTAMDRSAQLTIPQLVLAAGGAGFVTSFVLTPIELVKCKMQVQMMNFRPLDPPSPGRIPRRPATITPGSPTLHGTGGKAAASLNPLYSNHDRSALHHSACTKSHTLPAAAVNVRPPGAIALVRSIVDTYGVRGLWLGHTGTILRETGSSAAWFVTKEWVARKLIERRVHPSPHLGLGAKLEPTSIESAISGAVAGAVGALLFYPADTVKSAIQTEEELRPQSYNSKGQKAVFPKSTFVGTARMMYARHGLKGLYAGCGMTVARAVPSSCIIFVVYDGLISLFP